MPMPEQLPQIAILPARHPDPRKVIFQHQLQNMLRILPSLYESGKVYRHGCSSGQHLRGGDGWQGGKLIMECVLETKASTVVQFIQGLQGTLGVTFEEGTSAATNKTDRRNSLIIATP